MTWVSLGLIVMSLIFGGVGAYLGHDAMRFAGTALAAAGTVTSVERVESYDSDTGRTTHTYKPTLRYTAANGETYTGTTHISSSGYDFAVGETVAILYDPADPADVRVNSFVSLYMLPLVFGLSALVTLGLGIFFLVRARRQAA